MERSHRIQPSKLGKKLKQIRDGLGLSQSLMVKTPEPEKHSCVSSKRFSLRLKREPPLAVLRDSIIPRSNRDLPD
jgi:hypothetical protein